jgi:hypothetical protein
VPDEEIGPFISGHGVVARKLYDAGRARLDALGAEDATPEIKYRVVITHGDGRGGADLHALAATLDTGLGTDHRTAKISFRQERVIIRETDSSIPEFHACEQCF